MQFFEDNAIPNSNTPSRELRAFETILSQKQISQSCLFSHDPQRDQTDGEGHLDANALSKIRARTRYLSPLPNRFLVSRRSMSNRQRECGMDGDVQLLAQSTFVAVRHIYEVVLRADGILGNHYPSIPTSATARSQAPLLPADAQRVGAKHLLFLDLHQQIEKCLSKMTPILPAKQISTG